jgi:hypothetical protein
VFGPQASASGARLSQTYEVGSFKQLAPLKLTLEYRVEDCTTNDCTNLRRGPVALLDGHYTEMGEGNLRPSDQFTTVSKCLGASGHNGRSTLTLMPGIRPALAPSISPEQIPTTIIRDVSIERANPSRCPAQNGVQNGDFEASNPERWNIQNGAIVDNNDDRRLTFNGDQCDSGQASQRVAVPSDEQTALSFEVETHSGVAVTTTMTNRFLRTSAVGTDGAQTRHVCVPDADLGTVKQLKFDADYLPGRPRCQSAIQPAYIDDVRFTEREACASANSNFPGGSFDFKPARHTWLVEDYGAGSSVDFPTGAPAYGTYARLAVSQCARTDMRKRVQWPPEHRADPYNAIQFYVRTSNITHSFSQLLTRVRPFQLPSTSSTWKKKTYCFDPHLKGHLVDADITIEDTIGSCPETFPTNELHVDRFQFVHTPTCTNN